MPEAIELQRPQLEATQQEAKHDISNSVFFENSLERKRVYLLLY
jgi:hypothetical protein